MPNLSKLFEFRIFLILAIITLALHLLSSLGSLLGIFTDIILVVFLSWFLAFILEPLVHYFANHGLHRIVAAIAIYVCIALLLITLVWVVLPTTIVQLSQLATILPSNLPQNSLVSVQIQNFLTTSLSNSVILASQIASGLTGLLLVFILSFYLLISKKEISQFLKNLVPSQYGEDYEFLERVVNTTFASFIRIQVFLGLTLGLITFVSLSILKVNYALSTSVASAIFAMIPVAGAFLFLVPPALAALTISLEKLFIVIVILILAAQLIFNFLGPRLLGQALKIHPIIVLLSFLIGYKIASVWGAIFAVPITSSLTIIGKDLLKYWREEADK